VAGWALFAVSSSAKMRAVFCFNVDPSSGMAISWSG
jgi:hypothetical protein